MKSLFALIATLAVTATAFGQGYPLPSKSPNTPVVCNPAIWSACIDADAGKITPGWDLPVQNFTGRFLDSERTRAYQQGFRDARGLLLRVTSKRIYMVTGSGVLAYDIDRFFSRLAAGEPLVASTTIPVTGTWRDPPPSTPENLLKWDQFFNAEGSGWRTPLSDGWQRLFDVDSDDRGYVYLAYSEFGWGVVKDNFDTSGWMQSVFQGDNTLWPVSILSVKTSDGRYFAIVAQRGLNSQLWFMGDANGFQHVQRPNLNFSFARGAKSTDGSRVAIVDWSGNLSIYRSDDLVNGGAPIVTFNGGFTDVASDGTNFFGIWSQPFTSSGMVTLTPSGSTYSRTDYNFSWYYYKAASPASNPIIRYGGNLLAITGYEPTGWNVHLFQLSNLVPTEVVGRNGVPTRFFGQYYFGLDGFLRDQSLLYDAVPVKSGGKIYLVVAAWALADVWELAAGNSLAARMKAPSAGPYYGDKITFTTVANSNPSVNWNFGDGTGTTIVVPGAQGYPDVTHQYSGLTEATLPANGVSYQVVASNAADSTATDSLTLQLKAPQVGFRVQGHPELLFRQPDASSPAPIVSGDQFVDVFDGMAGGHYVDWSSTAVGTAQTGAGGSIGVGACGAYQVIYTAHYGPFDPGVTPFSIAAGSDAKYSINPFNYTVRPFAFGVTKSVGNTSMTFTEVSRLSGVADLPGGGGTGCTFLYELLNANNGVVNTMGGSATLATIPQYQATKMTGLVDGPMHLRLTVTVDPTALSSACSGFNTVVSTLDFDGTLVGGCGSINSNSAYIGFYGSTTGCTPANNACSASDSLTFSVQAQSPWAFSCEPFTYAWNFGDGQSGSGRQPSHSYTSNGTFNVTLVITDGSGTSATIHGSVSVNGGNPPPNPNPNPNPNPGGCASLTSQSAYVGFYGSSTGCTPATQSCNTSDYVTFTTYAQNNYSFTCSPYSYLWNFGDGQSSTASQPSHQYLSGGTYNVSLALQDGQGHSATISGSIRVAGGSNVNPNPSGCAQILPTSAYVGFYGGGTGCTPANDICTNGETIAFTLYPQNGYSFICSPYSYVWSFGDSKTSTDEQPTHQYATAGTYNISVSIRDSVGQSTTISGTIKVGSGSGSQPAPGTTPHRRPSGHH